MKKCITVILASFLIFCIPIVASAFNSGISMYLNGQKLSPANPPEMLNHHVYVTVDTIAALFHVPIDRSGRDGTWNMKLKDGLFTLAVGEWNAVSESGTVRLPAPPEWVGEKLYIPLRFVADHSGMKISWDALTQSVSLYEKASLPSVTASQVNPIVQTESKVLPVSRNNTLSFLKLPAVTGIRLSADTLVIDANQTLAASVMYLTDPEGKLPDRLAIDMPGVEVGQELTDSPEFQNNRQSPGHPYVKEIRYSLFSREPSTVRVVLELGQAMNYTVSYGESELQLVVNLSPKPVEAVSKPTVPVKTYKIVIDPGHGGDDPGASSPDCKCGDVQEKEFNLKVAKKVEALMKKDAALIPILTRTDDSKVSLDERVGIANDANADLFVSIHANTFEQAISGTETYYWNSNSASFADLMHAHVVKATGFRDREVIRRNYRVVKNTEMPAILLEVGYMSTEKDRKLMWTDEFQTKLAQSIVDGVKEYLKKQDRS